MKTLAYKHISIHPGLFTFLFLPFSFSLAFLHPINQNICVLLLYVASCMQECQENKCAWDHRKRWTGAKTGQLAFEQFTTTSKLSPSIGLHFCSPSLSLLFNMYMYMCMYARLPSFTTRRRKTPGLHHAVGSKTQPFGRPKQFPPDFTMPPAPNLHHWAGQKKISRMHDCSRLFLVFIVWDLRQII